MAKTPTKDTVSLEGEMMLPSNLDMELFQDSPEAEQSLKPEAEAKAEVEAEVEVEAEAKAEAKDEQSDVTPGVLLAEEEVETLQQAKVSLGEGNQVIEGTEQQAEAMTVPPSAPEQLYASIDKPLYGTRAKVSGAKMMTYAVSIKDAYTPDNPAYSNPEARTQYFITATSQGAAISQLKQVFPQYSEFEAKLL